MDSISFNSIVSFIWGIADDCLRDVYVRGKYRDVILPMTVIRRLDAVLEETKPAVLEMKKKLDEAGITNQTASLCQIAGEPFCNSSPFCLKDLKSKAKAQQLKTDFEAYLDGFSPNVQEILDKFKFRNQIATMIDADILGSVIEKFVSPTINLSPRPVLHDDGSVKLPGLDNHTMGLIFEELIRRFNEENNEEAGEHFTPRDAVELMADLIIMPIAGQLKDGTYTCYDGACGTGGMLTIAEKRLEELATQQGKQLSIHLFGQEINPETYAITKADMLLSGEGEQAEHMGFGSTLSADSFPARQFDFMLSNPPYGKSWKVDQDKLGGKKGIQDTRFVTQFADDPEYKMLPRSSDGQMLFLLNNIAKMKHSTALGSRIAEVHNGSSLFTGDAGSGESNARRFVIENDYLEAIIALPENMFYNTGIGTFIWIVSNRKAPHRKGKVQLIDATAMKSPLRKNLGKKNCELTPEIRKRIVDLYLDFAETEESKIFDNAEFGYQLITVDRPLRLKIDLSKEIPAGTFNAKDQEAWEKALAELPANIPMDDWDAFAKATNLKATLLKKVRPLITEIDENAKAVSGEADSNLRDYERVPLLYPGGIEAFFNTEVKPFVPDAWIDHSKTQIGYELSFTKYFYKPVELRSLDEITADLRQLESETAGLLDEILGGAK
ncbi:MAG: SAM-dependent DNA methyltransferase [Lentisphaerae bacterium]|nr:SAM-dependent DNA methyltransferase [Lentisphaerota bacterium]